jgi:hypothetical protein
MSELMLETENKKEIPAEWTAEADLADELGVPLARVRALRAPLPDAFTKKEGRRILLSREGVEAVSEALMVSRRLAMIGEEDAEDRDELFEVVTKKIPANPYIVLGEWFGNPVRVRVPDSKKFVPGMRLKCRLVEGDVMALVGRGPRFKGKW